MNIVLNSHVSALPCCFALPSGSCLSAVKFDCSTPSATRITPKDNQCIFQGLGCKVWMSVQDHLSKLFGSTFQQLTRSGFTGDAKTNAECVPASQKSIPIFPCKVVLDLWVNKLRDTWCIMSRYEMWICMSVSKDIQDGGCSNHTNIAKPGTTIWYWAGKHNLW